MDNDDYTSKYDARKQLVKNFAEMYCTACLIVDLYKNAGTVEENQVFIKQKSNFIYLFERILSCCSADTRFIITNTFVRREKEDWYIPFYSRSSYYRIKKEAIEEFNAVVEKLKNN